MKKYYYDMKIFFLLKLLIIIFSFQNYLLAGAPPMNKDPIPPGPYSFIKTNHLIVGVEWEKSFLQKFLPSKFENISIITGGINIFNSKKNQPYSPLSGSFGWIDLPSNNNEEKLIIFSIYGLNKTINDIMKSVYNLESVIGSNKVTLINDNAVATSSIRKKNVISISASKLENCKESSGKDYYIAQFSKSNIVRKNITWNTDKYCDAKPIKVVLKGSLEKFKIKKVLWAKTRENANVTIEEPVSNN